MRTNLATFSTLLFSSALFCSLVPAGAQVLNAIGQGNYGGYYHASGDNGYLTGYYYSTNHHSYFVFDLNGVTGPITYAGFSAPSAGVSFYAGGVYTPVTSATDTFTLYAVTDSVASVEAGYPGQSYSEGNQIYSDLVSGPAVGSVTVSSANDSGSVKVTLNSAGLAFLNANEGNKVVLGGALSGNNGIFESNSGASTPELTLAPEPGTCALLASILLTGAGFLKGRRRTR